MRRRRWATAAVLTLVAGLGCVPAASAARQLDGVVREAQQALRGQLIFVHADTDPKVRLTGEERRRLRALIRELRADVFIATLPAVGDPVKVLQRVSRGTGRDGTYLVITGRALKASSNTLPDGVAADISRRAFVDHRADGVFAVLRATIHAVAEAERDVAASTDDEPDTLVDNTIGVPYDPVGSADDGGFGGSGSIFAIFVVVAIGLAIVRAITGGGGGGGWGSGSLGSGDGGPLRRGWGSGFFGSGGSFGGGGGSHWGGGSSSGSDGSSSGGSGSSGGFDSGGGGGSF